MDNLSPQLHLEKLWWHEKMSFQLQSLEMYVYFYSI